jgi:hypothetical protein
VSSRARWSGLTGGVAATRAGRIEVRVGGGKTRTDCLLPGAQFGPERVGAAGMLAIEILLFTAIGGEVEQLEALGLEPFDQLPIAPPDGAAGCASWLP